jgi:sulfur carrier protein
MNITLNGNTKPLNPDQRLQTLLIELGLSDKRVAVEVNGMIVPRSQHHDFALQHGDQVEIVVAVGGG